MSAIARWSRERALPGSTQPRIARLTAFACSGSSWTAASYRRPFHARLQVVTEFPADSSSAEHEAVMERLSADHAWLARQGVQMSQWRSTSSTS